MKIKKEYTKPQGNVSKPLDELKAKAEMVAISNTLKEVFTGQERNFLSENFQIIIKNKVKNEGLTNKDFLEEINNIKSKHKDFENLHFSKQEKILQKLIKHFKTCPTKEEFKKTIIKWAGLTALAPGGVFAGTGPLMYNIIKRIKCHGLSESLYYGTSTTFQQEITENGIKSPSKWGNYGLAEENAMKIVEKHGGEPMVINIMTEDFDITKFQLDESHNDVLTYTETLNIHIEKKNKVNL